MENAKPAPDPLALGQRYLEIGSINADIAAQDADTRTKITAQLTSRQMSLLQQISSAAVQSGLLNDARCGFLAGSLALPLFNGPILTIPTAVFGGLSDVPVAAGCAGTYPISIRNYLGLTDAEVASILTLQSGFTHFQTQKNNRTADVQVELRDELAKPVLDSTALGVRYIELSEITGEIISADATARSAARALLTPAQQATLQSLVDASALTNYLSLAVRCHLLTAPPGISGGVTYYPTGSSCQVN